MEAGKTWLASVTVFQRLNLSVAEIWRFLFLFFGSRIRGHGGEAGRKGRIFGGHGVQR